MTRVISSGTSIGIGADVAQPGYLVKIGFTPPLRFSSRGTLTWDGASWEAAKLQVSGLAIDAQASSQTGRITIADPNFVLSALVLLYGIAGKSIEVWAFYGDSPATEDPVNVFSGVGDSSAYDPDAPALTVDMRQAAGITLYCPRTYINAASGHSFLPAAGTLLSWNGETYELKPEQN